MTTPQNELDEAIIIVKELHARVPMLVKQHFALDTILTALAETQRELEKAKKEIDRLLSWPK